MSDVSERCFFTDVYEDLYENDRNGFITNYLVPVGDTIIHECPELARRLFQVRGDVVSSDREAATFAVWADVLHPGETVHITAMLDDTVRAVLWSYSSLCESRFLRNVA